MKPDFHHCPRCGREPRSADFRRVEQFFVSSCRACGEVFCDRCSGDDDRCPKCGGEDIEEHFDFVSPY